VIREELSQVISREVKDPRVGSVTVTQVEVAQDGSHANVLVSRLGGSSEREMRECIEGLTRASGFLRKHLAGALTIRHVPTLAFKEDKGLQNTTRVFDLLKQIELEPKSSSDDTK
jgi:ribosome-binding factor A